MTDLDLTEAINTAAWDLDPVDGMEDEGRDGVTQAIRAAAPVIERLVRERIAAEIEAHIYPSTPSEALDDAQDAYEHAARIARGGAS